MNDKERFDWLEASKMDLICNYQGQWICILGFHGDIDDDITNAKPTIREAIDLAAGKREGERK